ncbi:helix-turn-helix domain-containing protein [Streptomyces sp. NBC_00386]|uniref:helix-turn-helix domain-containing protein n=1 Tax=Streptomyces sp. NBC_00386 TaxID=2975734 RepID=UPI002E225688
MASTTSPRWTPLPDGFGDLLRQARRRVDLTRKQLAAEAGVSPSCLQALEQSRRPPSASMADRLCEVLRLDPWEAAVVQAAAVDEQALRTRAGTRHVQKRRPRSLSPTRAITVPTPLDTCR